MEAIMIHSFSLGAGGVLLVLIVYLLKKSLVSTVRSVESSIIDVAPEAMRKDELELLAKEGTPKERRRAYELLKTKFKYENSRSKEVPTVVQEGQPGEDQSIQDSSRGG